MKKLTRNCAVLLAVFLLVSVFPGMAAASAEPVNVTSLEELAWRIVEGVDRGEVSFRFAGYSPFDDVQSLLNACGSGMWLNISMVKWTNPKSSGGPYTIELIFHETQEMRKECEQKAEEIVASHIKPGMKLIDKYKALHDWIVKNCTYDLNTEYEGQLAWDVLIGGRAVCNGYTKAFKLLCDTAGLNCAIAVGTATNSSGRTESHTWNVVPCDGQWLYIDTTWDDPVPDKGDKVSYEYFLLNKLEIEKDHSFSMDYSVLTALFCPEREDMADTLYGYGLLAGTGEGYDLRSVPDRHQCAAMYMKALGLGGAYEKNPTAYAHPFTDVVKWAEGHVAVMYTLGYTAGVGPTKYGGAQPLTLQQYCTFMLKALGYSTDSEFSYAKAVDYAVDKGLLSKAEARAIGIRSFLRGDMVMLSYRALGLTINNSAETLLDFLARSGAVDMPNAA